jgi:ABC-type nitrate/sulfonate/bicarbonate transport system substrate-binding protein
MASDYVNYPLSGVAASADFLAKNKPIAISFIKGLLEGAKFARENKSDSLSFIRSYLKVPDDEAEKSYDFLIKEMPPDLLPEDAVVRAAVSTSRKALSSYRRMRFRISPGSETGHSSKPRGKRIYTLAEGLRKLS